MNNQSPLIPQGSLQEQKNKGRARVRSAVFVVLAIHGIGLLALLLNACKKEAEPVVTNPEPTNTTPVFVEQTNPPPVDTIAVGRTNPPGPGPGPEVTPGPIVPTPGPGLTTDYKVVAGDIPSTIAAKFHVTTPALLAANPGLEPTKLKINQVLHIPAPAAPTAPGTGSALTPAAGGATTSIYTVKSGDNLTKIANAHGTTPKALRTLNNLSTDQLKVNQKLKIPVKGTAPGAPGTGAPVESTTAPPTVSPPASSR